MISVCILTKNTGSTLAATLASVSAFPEVIILDNGSTDNTAEIAAFFPNVRYFTSPFLGFGPLRNKAASLASNNWILAIDADEVLSPALLKELKSLELTHPAYAIPRYNYYNEKRIRGCGWGDEKVTRLYNRTQTSYCNSQVHESVLHQNPKKLSFPLLHTPYRSTANFLDKMQHYSTLFALQHKGKKHPTFLTAIGHALFAFFRSYFLKRGFLDGAEGFTISIYNANTTFYKYLKLIELNNN
jgi:glycosyltransferase involved in cell wall biosynthesis